MDIATQAILGAAAGEAVLGKKIGNRAMLYGVVAGILPDLDVVALPFISQVERLSAHRGISHSVFFLTAVAFVLSWLFHRYKRTPDISFQRWLCFFLLALLSHVLLDAFTGYGTLLLLPFSDARIGFDSIPIVDPFYTVPLLIPLIYCGFKNRNSTSRRILNYTGIAISTAYLVFTLFHKQQIEKVFTSNFDKQGISVQKVLTIPVSFGNILWYGVAKTSDGIYIGDYSRLDVSNYIRLEYLPTNDHLLEKIDPELARQLKWFAKDFYTATEQDGKIRFYNLQVDMTGTLPEHHAPTSFYFEITPDSSVADKLSVGVHPRDISMKMKWERIFRKRQ